MGDCGSNLLGLLLGAVIIEGSLKTNALIALVGPLVVLAVPFLDTGFVVAKRLKYRARRLPRDSNHFHHRFHRIGFSPAPRGALPLRLDADHGRRRRRAALHPLLRASGHLNAGWALRDGAACCCSASRRASTWSTCSRSSSCAAADLAAARADPDTSEHEIDDAGRARARDRRVPPIALDRIRTAR